MNKIEIEVPIIITFDSHNVNWSYTEHNPVFLKMMQNYANDMLKQRGHMFVNDVCDLIGVPRTPLGAIMGWIHRDGSYIDFGIWSDAEKLANPYEIKIKLYTQGVMYDKI